MSVKALLPREADDKLVPLAWRKAVHANPNLPQDAEVGGDLADAHAPCAPARPGHGRAGDPLSWTPRLRR
ncbi:hypothetical protein [Sphaerisporangium sp. NPDC051011]|uniref:hypothetical protein n=1 Tax=Sphaerisporangium sp. NPDC051011 TaxID=3155792 RepID=UPI003407B23E